MISENKTAYLLLIITTLGWGCNAVLAKLAVGEVSPMLLVSIRWPTFRGWIIIMMIVVYPSFISQISFIKSVGLIGPGRGGIFVNLVPIFSSILAVNYLGDTFESYHSVALLLVELVYIL